MKLPIKARECGHLLGVYVWREGLLRGPETPGGGECLSAQKAKQQSLWMQTRISRPVKGLVVAPKEITSFRDSQDYCGGMRGGEGREGRAFSSQVG